VQCHLCGDIASVPVALAHAGPAVVVTDCMTCCYVGLYSTLQQLAVYLLHMLLSQLLQVRIVGHLVTLLTVGWEGGRVCFKSL
jgi:hypothetical protein